MESGPDFGLNTLIYLSVNITGLPVIVLFPNFPHAIRRINPVISDLDPLFGNLPSINFCGHNLTKTVTIQDILVFLEETLR